MLIILEDLPIDINPTENQIQMKRSRKTDYKKFHLQKKTVYFRYNFITELYNDLKYRKNGFDLNLSKDEIASILKFKRKLPFKIVQCDKNIGIMLMSNENYNMLANHHLDNNNTYRVLDSDKTKIIIDNVNNKLKELLKNSNISKELFNFLKIRDSYNTKAGKFKILAKIHKEKFGIRPIINCIGYPTKQLCKFVD
jgi:hypothetical protein